MTTKKFTREEIAEGLAAYFMPAKEIKKLSDFDREVVLASQIKIFKLQAPEMVKQLFAKEGK